MSNVRRRESDVSLASAVLMRAPSTNITQTIPMKTQKAVYAVAVCLAISQSSCGGPTIPQVFAQCEADAYALLGLQTDEAATAEYLEKKQELVRVCMLKQGLSFKSSVPDGAWMDVSVNAHKKYGVYRTPQDQIPQEIQRSIAEEIRKERAKLSLRSVNWIK